MAPPVPLVQDLSIKDLANSSDLKTIPSHFTFVSDSKGSISEFLPIVDFSLLVSDNPEQRSEALSGLGKACEQWGFFVVCFETTFICIIFYNYKRNTRFIKNK